MIKLNCYDHLHRQKYALQSKKKIRTHNRTSLGELYVAVHTVHDLKLLQTTEPTYQNQLPGNSGAFTPDGLNNFILMPKMHILLKNYI
jgi:hypothetical protein